MRVALAGLLSAQKSRCRGAINSGYNHWNSEITILTNGCNTDIR
jgi:hypothetical protein